MCRSRPSGRPARVRRESGQHYACSASSRPRPPRTTGRWIENVTCYSPSARKPLLRQLGPDHRLFGSVVVFPLSRKSLAEGQRGWHTGPSAQSVAGVQIKAKWSACWCSARIRKALRVFCDQSSEPARRLLVFAQNTRRTARLRIVNRYFDSLAQTCPQSVRKRFGVPLDRKSIKECRYELCIGQRAKP